MATGFPETSSLRGRWEPKVGLQTADFGGATLKSTSGFNTSHKPITDPVPNQVLTGRGGTPNRRQSIPEGKTVVARVQLAEGDLSDPKDGRREAIVLKVKDNPQGLYKVFAQEGP